MACCHVAVAAVAAAVAGAAALAPANEGGRSPGRLDTVTSRGGNRSVFLYREEQGTPGPISRRKDRDSTSTLSLLKDCTVLVILERLRCSLPSLKMNATSVIRSFE